VHHCVAGKLVRGAGLRAAGSWELLDTSLMNGPGSWQLNVEDDGTWMLWSAFSDEPPVMRVGTVDAGGWMSDYVPANGDGSCVPTPPRPETDPPQQSDVSPAVASACAAPHGAAAAAVSLADARQRLVGTWMACGRPSLLGTYDDVGFELSADGRFYRLLRSPSGETVRGAGFDGTGTWEVKVATNAPGPYEIWVKQVSYGADIDYPAFSDDFAAMKLLTFGLDYVRVAP
jgi:hypothetical protein